MLWCVKNVTGRNHSTLTAVGIHDSKLFIPILLTDIPFLRTVDDNVETRTSFVVTIVMVESSITIICISQALSVVFFANNFAASDTSGCRNCRCRLLGNTLVKMRMKTVCGELQRVLLL